MIIATMKLWLATLLASISISQSSPRPIETDIVRGCGWCGCKVSMTASKSGKVEAILDCFRPSGGGDGACRRVCVQTYIHHLEQQEREDESTPLPHPVR
jgi:hypothetical protein